MEDMIRRFQKQTNEVLTESEKRSLRIGIRDEERRMLDEVVAQKVIRSYNGMFDPKPLRNIQGKDSDGEIVFFFEDGADANDLYSFMVEMHLMEPGEIVLRHIEGQSSVAFMPSVLVQKPELIQAALIAYEDLLVRGSEQEESVQGLVDALDEVLLEKAERYSISGAAKRVTPRAGNKKQASSGNPFHDKETGEFTGAAEIIAKKGGSYSNGKEWGQFVGSKKISTGKNKGNIAIKFGATGLPCGRKARDGGDDKLCWNSGKPGAGARLAKALGKKRGKKESLSIADLSVIMEVRSMYQQQIV